MNQNTLHKIIGALVFIIAAITYLTTVQPSVSFWDCGEFIASANLMQVPHPPGTPLFLLLGRVFSIIPFAENIAYRVNLISVFSSVSTVLFLYLIAVKLIENYKGKEHNSIMDAAGTYIAAAVGALSLAFADTFWFNAIEAEVYALSTFFIAFLTYLMIKWNESADELDNEKYMLMMAYLLGLSTGVHLMAVLGVVPIVMIVMFRKYITDESALKNSGYWFAGHALLMIFLAVIIWASETGTVPPSPTEYQSFDSRLVMILGAATVAFLVIKRKVIFQRNSFYIPLFIGGFALIIIYPGFVKYVPFLIHAISGNDYVTNVAVVIILVAALIYLVYWSATKKKETLNLVFKLILFAFIGYSTYSMIIIRSLQDTPINLNSPKEMSSLVSYVNREQYGDFPTFKRRFSQEPHQQHIYQAYSSDLDFFARYQMNHMFNRYLAWNYIGRTSTTQDSGVDITDLFAIPFLFGLLGLYFHFRKDWKMASVFLVMFIFLGYLTAFYQNQQEPQPRERDYFYVGAFFVYSIWIALGVRGLLDLILQEFRESTLLRPLFATTILASIVLVPAAMLNNNYHENDRSRNYVPWDYSYNILQSVAPNAVIFTNGDNDTFPLWYLQDVEGVRRDVRIANLSLLNTDWYIRQLKNTEPHGAAKIKMSFSDREIDRMGPVRWEDRNVNLPVPPHVYDRFGITDTSVINKGNMTWNMKSTLNFGNVTAVRVQDLAVLDIIKSNNWERPIYFAVTCSDNSKIGLQDYMQMEGMAFRITPQKHKRAFLNVNEEILYKQLFDEPEGYSKDYQPGFKFRGLDDPTIFMDSGHRRLYTNYRNSYLRLALHYMETKRDNEMAVKTLDMMEEKIPRKLVGMRYEIMSDLADLYRRAGNEEKFVELSLEVEEIALMRIKRNPQDFRREGNPYMILINIYESLKEYQKLVDLLKKLQVLIPNDPSIQNYIDKYERLARDSAEVGRQEIDIEQN
jgi:hypothetical protein